MKKVDIRPNWRKLELLTRSCLNGLIRGTKDFTLDLRVAHVTPVSVQNLLLKLLVHFQHNAPLDRK